MYHPIVKDISGTQELFPWMSPPIYENKNFNGIYKDNNKSCINFPRNQIISVSQMFKIKRGVIYVL